MDKNDIIIKMSSFLASFLLIEKEINYSDILNHINDIYDKEHIYISDYDDDIDQLSSIILFDNNKLILTKNYSDLIFFNGNNITVYDYLCGLSSEHVNNYFNEIYKNKTKTIA